MNPRELVYQTSGNMPSLFRSNSIASASSRSRSLPDNSQRPNAGSPYARRGSATIEALTRGLRKKSEVEIVLDGKDEFIRTYTTFDQIKGNVELKFERDTVIGDMTVCFEGQSQTYVEKIAAASPTTGRTTGKHTFLRVQQPLSAENLPEQMLAKANVVYSIPFTFVVPDKLLSYICAHKIEDEAMRKEHLQVPPSIGDAMLAGKGNILMDDQAPEMSKISYYVKARVTKVNPATERVSDIEEKIFRIRISPARDEAPPLAIEEKSLSYALRKEKNVRKGVFKIGKKLGRLTAEVAQPKSLRLPPAASNSTKLVTTMAAVTLRFDPASELEQPPQLGNLAAKLKAYTFFGAAAYRKIPEPSTCDAWSPLHGMYPDTISLASRNVGSVVWTKHDPGSRQKSVASQASTNSENANLSRRQSTDSASSSGSDASIPAASSAYDPSLPYYSARVLVPVSLPQQNEETQQQVASSKAPLTRSSKKIIFLPTFHTCIISRSYALELGLSFHPLNASGSATNALSGSSVTLRTPIQISQEGSNSGPPPSASPDYIDLSLIEGTDEYDEAMARHLDQQLNFSNPFGDRPIDAIPEYEEVQTTYGANHGMTRHGSIAVPPLSSSTPVNREQPPEYYSSPFRDAGASQGMGGRRHTVVTQYPTRSASMPMMVFLSAM